MDASAFAQHYALDQHHFWRLAKRRLLLSWLEAQPLHDRRLSILDIGSATSLWPLELSRLGEVVAMEPDREAVRFAERQLGIQVLQGELPDDIPFEGPFDVVTLLDVLEHIDDDRAALDAIHRRLAPEGLLLLNVPALSWLWSGHDVVLHHKRRYHLEPLLALLEERRFKILRASYWTTALLPLVMAQRLASKLRRKEATYDVRVPARPVNRLLSGVMQAEQLALRHVDLPIGSSIAVLCQRR